MKKIKMLLINIKYKIALFFLLFSSFCSFSKTISIDIGHNLDHPGAISAFFDTEFEYNRNFALVLKEEFEKSKYKVNLINESGNILDLDERVNLAKNTDFFLSIHHDSVNLMDLDVFEYNGEYSLYNDKVHGYSLFVSEKNKEFNKSLSCSLHISKNLKKDNFKPNFYHSKDNYGVKRELYNLEQPVYRFDNLRVLRKSTQPAILIEVGVIVNRNEAILLKNKDYILNFSKNIVNSFDYCMN